MSSLNQMISSYKQIKRTKNVYSKPKVLLAYPKLAIIKTFLSSKAKKSKPETYKLFSNNINYISFNTLFFFITKYLSGLSITLKRIKISLLLLIAVVIWGCPFYFINSYTLNQK